MIERSTEELRVVKNWLGNVVAVQRKFLVQDGEYYSPQDFGPPKNKEDQFVGVLGDQKPYWCPMKAVWRDLDGVEAGSKEERES